jgi:sulfate adenylyltransferase subunit 2
MTNMTLAQSIQHVLSDNLWHDTNEIFHAHPEVSKRHLLRAIDDITGEVISSLENVTDVKGKHLNQLVLPELKSWITKKRFRTRIVQITKNLLVLSDLRGHIAIRQLTTTQDKEIISALNELTEELQLIPHGRVLDVLYQAVLKPNLNLIDSLHSPPRFLPTDRPNRDISKSHLWELEQESIHIIREAVAKAKNPGMLFSLGKDSMVMLRLAQKAFAPEKIPFPLVNIDTRWKFQEMNTFREWIKDQSDFETLHFINPEAIEEDINPFDQGSAIHTDITKTQALKILLDQHKFDFVFGGARRDEEKSRAKERVFSVRDKNHAWDPKNQRPELWDFYNTTLVNDQSMRVFPLSNWTERDIWDYLEKENVPLVPLYFAKIRPFVKRNGSLIMVDDERFRLEPNETVHFAKIRFRSLGCYPLSGGVESNARNVSEIAEELKQTRVSERSSRVIDFDRGASMEQKKKEGYF